MDFQMSFIKRSDEYCKIDRYVPAPLFRHTFFVKGMSVKSAILLISGLGYYEAFLNGLNITKGYFAPYRSNLDDYIYYDKYEITDSIKQGKNVLACILGNGFQNPIVENWNFSKTVWRGAPMLSFNIEIEYNNGEKDVFISNEDTKTNDSPIVFNDLHYGEYYDSRLEIKNWNEIDFSDEEWDNAKFSQNPHGIPRLCTVEPIIERGRILPCSIIKYKDGYIYDFGVNDSGICELNITGECGQKIVLKHFEKMVNGEPFLNNIKFRPEQRFQEDEYICSGMGLETHIPKFTYHGFRYVYVTGIKNNQATNGLLTFILLSSCIKRAGHFRCNNDTVCKIQEATIRSDISNFYYFPTDCPQREKNGWTADAALSIENLLLNFYAEKSLKEWLINIYKSMDDFGRIPGIVPNSGWGYKNLNGPAWDSVIVYIPYYIFLYRGDKEVLDDLKIPLMRYLTFLYTLINEDGLIEYGLGDWCQADTSSESAFDTPKVVTNSIISLDIAEKSAFIFNVLNMEAQEQYARSLSKKLKIAIREKLIDKDNLVVNCKTQTGQAMAIYYNVFEPFEREKAVNNLVRMINDNKDFMKVGVLGGRVIFRVLAENGYADLAYHMITRKEYPSYGNWIERGATTLWERFTLDDTAKGSLNHHFWGDVSAWFYTYLSGIKINPNRNNSNYILISPCFVNEIEYVDSSVSVPNGKISVCWEREKEKIKLKIECQDGIEGEIILRDGFHFSDNTNRIKLESGVFYVFS